MARSAAERSSKERATPESAPAPTGDYLARVHELAPALAAASDEIDRKRELPEAIVAGLIERGLFRLLLPRSLGGAELLPAQDVPIIAVLAKTDASAARCVTQNAA